jgi:glycine/D-amino acid oxidase-like deaminating enzyme
MSPELLEAYKRSEYIVHADEKIVLRIGAPNAALDALMEAEGARTAVFITAANPGSDPRPAGENAAANAALEKIIAGSGYPHFRGEGRDPQDGWCEPSFLVLGIYRANAEALGRLFAQNAIVFAEQGRPPELLVLST